MPQLRRYTGTSYSIENMQVSNESRSLEIIVEVCNLRFAFSLFFFLFFFLLLMNLETTLGLEV